MGQSFAGYQAVLAATDFSDHSAAAVARAVWVAQQSSKRLMVAHVASDLRKAIHQTSYRSRIEFLEGHEEHFQRELRRSSDEQLKSEIARFEAAGIDIELETLLGDPSAELTQFVVQKGYDLVVAGTRGHSGLKRLVLGSTAKKLIQHCPASLWIVKNKDVRPLTNILAAVDMSDVSGRALSEAVWIARQSGAQLHILHVITTAGLNAELLEVKVASGAGKNLRELIENEVTEQLQQFLAPLAGDAQQTTKHMRWGVPAPETVHLAAEINADLIVMGTVGRHGVAGLLLGNTAETVLTYCDCDVLVVKPANL